MVNKNLQKRDHLLPLRTARLLSKEQLCSNCLERQGVSKELSKVLSVKDASTCSLCRGVTLALKGISESTLSALEGFEFETFLVGASLPQAVLDREDEIRSRYKIRGQEGIKVKATRAISRKIRQRLGKNIDYLRPDLTILTSLVDSSVSIIPRSVWASGSYIKKARGVSQKSTTCKTCNGVGCANCDYNGSALRSVESILSSYLKEQFEANGCNFVWIGSEDSKSLVGGGGRPFFVEIARPRRRKLIKPASSRNEIDLGPVSLARFELMQSRPRVIPQFKIDCIVYLIQTESSKANEEGELKVEEIERLSGSSVQVRLSRKYRVVTRNIRSISVERDYKGHPYALKLSCDGGIPIRKFVSGEDGTVTPNLSEFISGFKIDPECPFDIVNLELLERVEGARHSNHSRPSHGYRTRRALADNQEYETPTDEELLLESSI